MRTQILALAVIALIAVGANLALDEVEYDTADRTTADSVRLD